jgi:hypothetical protein
MYISRHNEVQSFLVGCLASRSWLVKYTWNLWIHANSWLIGKIYMESFDTCLEFV